MTDAAPTPPQPPARPRPPAPPWLQWRVGQRVVVRYRVDGGLSDALGDLLEVRLDGVVVRTRSRGDVDVPAALMVGGKLVPPAPSRPQGPPPHGDTPGPPLPSRAPDLDHAPD
ncbi:hypothetical protein [Georgenia sp. SYP-B2076]|uniref:putative acetyltransferase n=1 Tax=Georgenia sp. SYP-B2076 TaxID=2495881 RepID=UPI0013DF4059|nr:hypothetical protein [Georgenia sp. SYP-B2076]